MVTSSEHHARESEGRKEILYKLCFGKVNSPHAGFWSDIFNQY